VFWILFSISIALVVLALFSWFSVAVAAPLMMRDSQGFTAVQRDRVGSWLITMAGSYALVLGITNALWIAGARYLLRCLSHKDEHRT
jgi:ligand-binding sensor domain-containing protein